MTAVDEIAAAGPVTWQGYQDIVRHARAAYLETVQAARELREETQAGAFEAFTTAERHAWTRYHDTGRRAWLNYQSAQRNLPVPTFTPAPDSNPYPETGDLNEFDQRQETYLAADPAQRDNP